MPRFTRRAFADLAIWMVLFGLLTGIAFPFFAILLGVPAATALTASFIAACCGAGLLVAGVNFLLARRVVGARLRVLSSRMRAAAGSLRESELTGRRLARAGNAHIPVDSEDELGDTAAAFNLLVDSLTRSHEALSARAASDPLTGLANHGAFQDRLRSEVERAWRHRRPLSLAILDLDHFKRVNDTFGHQVGDDVLVEVARLLAGMTRAGELLARTGGEEFAWILPETNGAEAQEAGDRVCRAFARKSFPEVGQLTVSIGVCDLSEAQDAGSIYGLADEALYLAKFHGRDNCFLYSSDSATELEVTDRASSLVRSHALAGLWALARAVDAKDPSTLRHSDRVATVAVHLAAALDWPARRQGEVRQAALLHDVGKIGVPDSVLAAPGRLSHEQYETVKRHAALGAEIAEGVLTPEQASWIRSHHERWDGQGYPDGLRGEAIPDGARLLAVAEAWDEMTRTKAYREELSHEGAMARCTAEAGKHFCPAVVAALVRTWQAGLLEIVEPPADQTTAVSESVSASVSAAGPVPA